MTSGIDVPVCWNSQGEDYAAGPPRTGPHLELVPTGEQVALNSPCFSIPSACDKQQQFEFARWRLMKVRDGVKAK